MVKHTDHNQTLRNIIISFFLTLLSAIFGYVLRVYLARNYAVAEYGLIYAMITFFSFMLIFIDLGLTQSVTRKVAEYRAKKDTASIKRLFFTVFVYQLSFTFILSLIFYLFAAFFTNSFFHSTDILFFRIMILWFLTMPLYYFLATYFLSYEKTTWWCLIELIKILFILTAAFILSNTIGLVAVYIAYGAVNLFVFLIFIPKIRDVFQPVLEWKMLPKTLIYGIYVSLGALGWGIFSQADTLIITYFKGLADVGLYQAALPLASIMYVAVTPITIVLFSTLATLWARKDKKGIAKTLLFFYRYLSVILFPLTGVLTVFAVMIINIIFGMKYVQSSTMLTILALAYMVNGIVVVQYFALSAIGKAKYAAKIILSSVALNVLLSVVLINLIGTIGVALSTLTAYIIMAIFLTIKTSHFIKIRLPVFVWLKTAAASALFIMVLIFAKRILVLPVLLEIFLCVSMAGIVYLLALFLMRVVTMEDFYSVKELISSTVRKKSSSKD